MSQKISDHYLAQHPSGCQVKDRTGRTGRRDDHLDGARPAPGNGSAAEGHRPSLERDFSRFTSCLNRLVRTRMLGGVGAGEGNLPGYPIGCRSHWVSKPTAERAALRLQPQDMAGTLGTERARGKPHQISCAIPEDSFSPVPPERQASFAAYTACHSHRLLILKGRTCP